MPALDSKLRSQLDDVCQKARDLAVAYAQSALQKRGVDAAEALSHFGPNEKELRNRLRARGRQVGDVRNADGTQSIEQLSQELAYEYWHRMLFARFLAENHLLMHPDGVAVSLEECDELAPEADPPTANGFVLAARYASTMLPQIFRTDDVLLEIEFAPEQRLALEKLLASLPKQTFEADDSLGWVYQFWQTAEKKRVNDSGDKIDGRTLPAVTQLFTEHYMVEFLLHNTIGAWWCAKEGIQGPPGGAGIPAGMSPVEMPYLRWRDDGTPAAGKFEGWPKTLAEFAMLDPCCGSGHFLVAAFNLLVPLRMHDQGLSAAEASEAVLRDNIFGLELDPRCTQIAAFALALAAWKYPDAGGYRPLPTLNIACSGQGMTGKKEEWLALANGNDRLREGMDRLYDLFQQAPDLGSLIDPQREKGDIFVAGFADLQALFSKALASEKVSSSIDASTMGVSAQGVATAAHFLSKRYTLIPTNVPYLVRNKQGDTLWQYCERNHSDARGDLAAAFLSSSLPRCITGGTVALVAPQNILFLSNYKLLRNRLLQKSEWNGVARLGPGAFETISGAVVNVALMILSNQKPSLNHLFCGIDLTAQQSPDAKARSLSSSPIDMTLQSQQVQNPDSRIEFNQPESVKTLLAEFCECYQGLVTGDQQRFTRSFWEVRDIGERWSYLKSSCDDAGDLFGGQSQVLLWEGGNGQLSQYAKENRDRLHDMHESGNKHWGKEGVAIDRMTLRVSVYTGEPYDNNTAVVVPHNPLHLLPILAFCRSEEFADRLRSFDHSLKFTNQTLVKVPFDLPRWEAVAQDQFPNGLPDPCSKDPTQWLFRGGIQDGVDTLQIAVAIMLRYRWPNQSKNKEEIDKLTDGDGILCLPGVRGEAAASERLLEILHAAYHKAWSDSVLHQLLTDVGCKAGTTLDDWLRNQFFEQHCKRFQNRPFIWHIWDGRKDGFSALVNYHKLTHKALENLTYSYLGDWITAQSKSDKAGADLRLGAAQALQEKLKLILAGEPPHDIFVRWKPLHEQAIGWNPDLNDGVRMNIRPFMEAGILRKNPNIKWSKDRGKEPQRDKADYLWFWSGKDFVGDRVNDVHLTNAEKQAARSRKKGAK